MVPRINRILYATDMSKNARFAFSYAASLAEKYDAKITIIHILETLPESIHIQVMDVIGNDEWERLQKEKLQGIINKIKERLADFCDEMGSELSECKFLVDDIVVEKGVPVDEILGHADTIDADLIVMGTHGYGMVMGALMGSTARRVIRRSKKPVFVIRLPEK